MARISYQFTVPHDYNEVADAVINAVRFCNARCDWTRGGQFTFKLSPGFGYFAIKFTVYISETNGVSTIRILTDGADRKTLHFRTYDMFLTALEEMDILVPVVTGEPYIVTASQIGGGVEQRFDSRQSVSVSGAVIGSFLFGDLGAVAGAYGGPTRGKMKSVLSNSALFTICYSNGMIEEREIKKGTKEYAEIMAKLNAKPIIRK